VICLVIETRILHDDPSDPSTASQIRCSKKVYNALEKSWNIPRSALKILAGRAVGNRINCHAVKGVALVTQYCGLRRCMVLYDPETNTTNALIESARAEAMKDVLDSLKALHQGACVPSMLLLLMLQMMLREHSHTAQVINESVSSIRESLSPCHISDPADLDWEELVMAANELEIMAQHIEAIKAEYERCKILSKDIFNFHQDCVDEMADYDCVSDESILKEIEDQFQAVDKEGLDLMSQFDMYVSTIDRLLVKVVLCCVNQKEELTACRCISSWRVILIVERGLEAGER
jgi:hypothetical protein